MGKEKNSKASISGKRLAVAREIRKLTWQELADALKVGLSTAQKWADPSRKGIPKGRLFFIATYFGVEELVFTNESLEEKDFKKIINDPASIAEFRHLRQTPAPSPESPSMLGKESGMSRAKTPFTKLSVQEGDDSQSKVAVTADRLTLALNLKQIKPRHFAAQFDLSIDTIC